MRTIHTGPGLGEGINNNVHEQNRENYMQFKTFINHMQCKHLQRLNKLIKMNHYLQIRTIVQSGFFRMPLGNISNRTLKIITTYRNHMHNNPHFRLGK